MLKKLFSFMVILSSFFMPIFWVEVRLPSDPAGNITVWRPITKTRFRGDENTLFNTVNLVNKYLRSSFAVICTAMLIYWGFKLITAEGDSKAIKKAQRIFIGTWVWIIIAMLSYAFVSILGNIM